MNNRARTYSVIAVGLLVLLVFVGSIIIHIEYYGTRSIFSMLLFSIAAITYFGFYALPGGFKEDTGFTETRVRLSIVSTLVMTYLAYFSLTVFWKPDSLEQVSAANFLLETLTNLLIVVLPFYFGATAVTEILSKRSTSKGEEKPAGNG